MQTIQTSFSFLLLVFRGEAKKSSKYECVWGGVPGFQYWNSIHNKAKCPWFVSSSPSTFALCPPGFHLPTLVTVTLRLERITGKGHSQLCGLECIIMLSLNYSLLWVIEKADTACLRAHCHLLENTCFMSPLLPPPGNEELRHGLLSLEAKTWVHRAMFSSPFQIGAPQFLKEVKRCCIAILIKNK